jgi:uncharacterized phage protein (TIGR02218 family)
VSKEAINYQSPYDETSLIDYLAGAALETAVCWKLTPARPLRAPRAVSWTSVSHLTEAANSLHCALTGSSDYGDHGAVSSETFTDEGRLQFRRGTLTGEMAIGLSESSADNHYNTIEFCWRLSVSSNAAYVYESGTLRKNVTLPPATATFAIVRLWNYDLSRYEITYTVDDELVYTSALTPGDELLVDAAFSGLASGAAVEVELTQEVESIGATSHTQDLTLPGHDGVIFKSSQGGVPSTVDAETGHKSAGLSVESVFDSAAAITREAVEAGDWARAKFEMYTVNLRALAMGQLVEFSGRLGRIETEGPAFTAEARPKTSVAEGQVGRLAVAKCDVRRFADAAFDNRCKLARSGTAADGGAMVATGTVTAATDNTAFTDSSRSEADDYFTMGEVTFTTGPLAGRTFEVREYDGATKTFTLRRAASLRIGVGWEYEALRGCDRTAQTCSAKFNNILNYRGEPFITNIEKMNKIRRATT